TCTYLSYSDYSCPDCSDQTFTLDGSGTFDIDDETMTYSWSVTSGDASIDDDTSMNPEVTVTGITAEYGSTTDTEFELELEVTDCYGDSATDVVVLTVSCTGE
ncbi:MAG: hypothetical protein QGG40_16615, partial [Myxococcota bacterium]|nr:hypothetical protein [Myxococcota bacterium]